MKPGDRVIVLEDPLNYGVGVIQWVEPDGRLMVAFQPPTDSDHWIPFHIEPFDAHDLELEAVWAQAS